MASRVLEFENKKGTPLTCENGVCEDNQTPAQGGTFQVDEFSGWARDLRVEVAGGGVVGHTGSVAVRLLADRSGLTGRLSKVLNPKTALVLHDRGRVMADTAVMIADGGRVMTDLAVLRDQGELFGPVASDTTLWRTLDGIDDQQLARISAARAKTRVHVWGLIAARHGQIPPARLAGQWDLGKTVVIRLDASIVPSHSDKEGAAATFKKTWGHHPLTAWCDNTDECLALKLRPGNAGSNTARDHKEVLTEAIRQIPGAFRRDLLITCDGAGSTHDLIQHITTLNSAAGRKCTTASGSTSTNAPRPSCPWSLRRPGSTPWTTKVEPDLWRKQRSWN